jgi:hypothetical protein
LITPQEKTSRPVRSIINKKTQMTRIYDFRNFKGEELCNIGILIPSSGA